MSFESVKKIYAQDLFSQSSTAKERLGTIRVLEDGRKFVYCKAGGVNLAAGKMIMSTAHVANHVSIVVAANAAIGAKRVSVTLGATAAAANLYADGFFHVVVTPGEGHTYKIRGHAAIGSAGTGWIDLYDPIRVALTTDSDVSLVKSPCDGVLVTDSATPAGHVVGVAPIAVTASYYFWAQSEGPASVLTDGTVVVANGVICTSTAGAIGPIAETSITRELGTVIQVGATTEYSLIDLRC